MKKILIFVASGFSTRMGGFPKALAKVDEQPVILSAIMNANKFYDYIYVVCNQMTYSAFCDVIQDDALVRTIITGKGDAESVWKSIKLVESEIGEAFDCTFCWGDAYFPTSTAFQCIMTYEKSISQVSSILVGCSIDQSPYAYFDFYTINGNMSTMYIQKSYFKKKDGEVLLGMHDQCIFRCVSNIFTSCLDEYRINLGFDGENYTLSPTNEMGLLNSFTFLYKIGLPASICLIPSSNVFSFNTIEELQTINDELK